MQPLFLNNKEINAITAAYHAFKGTPLEDGLLSIIEKSVSTEPAPKYRYVVICATSRRQWDKVFNEVGPAKDYAATASKKYRLTQCRIKRQKWVSTPKKHDKYDLDLIVNKYCLMGGISCFP